LAAPTQVNFSNDLDVLLSEICNQNRADVPREERNWYG
jgi:hypothetical protein